MPLDDVVKAIADPTRRDILAALSVRDMPVHEIKELFPISRPAISKHLAILGSAGLVTAHRVGKENVYQMNAEILQEVADWLNRFWAGRLTLLKSLAERSH